jgi:WD40 repeat protein
MLSWKNLLSIAVSLGLVIGVSYPCQCQIVKSSGNEERLLYNLPGHSYDVTSMVFTPDGRSLVSGGFDHKIKLWNLKTGKLQATLQRHYDQINALAISPNGELLASGGGTADTYTDKTITIWDLKTRKILYTLKGHELGITSLAFSPDGETLVSSSFDGSIKLWNPKTGIFLRNFTKDSHWIRHITISPDGELLASGGGNFEEKIDNSNPIKLWNFKTGKLLHVFQGHNSSISRLVINHNSGLLASIGTGALDKVIKLWNLKTRKLIYCFNGSSFGEVTAIAISPNGKTLVNSGEDGSLNIWDLRIGKLIKKIYQPITNNQAYSRYLGHYYINSIAFNPDGDSLAIGIGGSFSNFAIKIFRIESKDLFSREK